MVRWLRGVLHPRSRRIYTTRSQATKQKHVLIVGAGVAGLQTARALDKQGIKFTILERNDDVGGVWRDNYEGYALQVPWPVYEFPEFRYPKSYKLKFLEYPDGRTVQRYIKDYTTHFQLWDHIHLGATLLSAQRSKGVRSCWGCLCVHTLSPARWRYVVGDLAPGAARRQGRGAHQKL